MASIRVGIGFDIHRLAEGHRLMLAGVEVRGSLGAVAHSDGDVVLHAVCDAILGAAGKGDIGQHFPDTDPTWAEIDSAVLLGHVLQMVREEGWRVASADINIVLEQPKLAGAKADMQRRMAALLDIEPNAVGMKARTMEGLGPIGENQAVAAQAVVVLEANE